MQKRFERLLLLMGGLAIWFSVPVSIQADEDGPLRDSSSDEASVMVGPVLVLPTQRPQRKTALRAFDAAKVRKSIESGVGYLKEMQSANGSWRNFANRGDMSALCTLALLNCDEPPDAPYIRRALDYVLTCPGETTYFVSLRIMALVAADPRGKRYRADVMKDVQWLLEAQVNQGRYRGGWDYGMHRGASSGGDSSNSQFALLALHEATRMGIKIPQKNWLDAKHYWSNAYDSEAGDFRYYANRNYEQQRGSMTCAGISSMIIIHENLADAQNGINGQFANCCQPVVGMDMVKTAFAWLAKNFTVRSNPVGRGGGDALHRLYYLYGLERAARLAGRRFIGANDWYRDGAKQLIAWQFRSGYWETRNGHGEKDPLVATSFALLFLSKGKRPVAIGKFDHGVGDWDLHPKGIHYLTRRLEKAWDLKLNWQTVRAENSTIDDLLEAPVLFMSGKDAIGLNAKQKSNLKQYIENGGFLFAEACKGDGCGDAQKYDLAFRQLMAELFPDSDLEALDPSHPIWNAGTVPLLPNSERPLLGLQACCRTSVVYCPANLSCYWALDRPAILENTQTHPKLVQRIEYCANLGVSVVSYATGRNPKEKGETPTIVEKSKKMLPGRVLVFPKLIHNGGDNEAPSAWRNILRNIQRLSLEINIEKKMISPTRDQLADHPFVFIHGRRTFSFTPDERKALRDYLEAGGFVFADAICASPEFAKSFREEMKAILGQPLVAIPGNHDIWTNEMYGYRLDRVVLRIKDSTAPGGFRESIQAPAMEGAKIDGRYVVIFSRYDISCAMENSKVSECTGYTREGATQIATNIILYNLLSDAEN